MIKIVPNDINKLKIYFLIYLSRFISHMQVLNFKTYIIQAIIIN